MSEASNPIRVLIADDHLVVREGLRLILETSSDLELVGEAANGAEVVRLAQELQPDVILVDLRMPELDGFEALKQIRAQRPDQAIIILTNYDDDDLLLRSLRAGARGYLLKDASRQTLLDALRTAARGETLLQPEVLARVLAHTTVAANDRPVSAHARGGVELTEREREVLAAAARGERTKEIAARLHITERTVKAHLENIYAKLGVDSRAAAVMVAMQRGLLSQVARESGPRLTL